MKPTMRAAQYDKRTSKILVHSIPVPAPGPSEVLVRLTAASLCHSDLMTSLRPSPSTHPSPITIGHEAVGTVSQIHPSISSQTAAADIKLGDAVGMFYIEDCCFECEGCKVHGTFCNRPGKGGAKICGLQRDGFFTKFAVCDWRNVVKLPGGLGRGVVERMSPVFCAGVTAFHAVDKCNLQPGQWLAVVGCGGLGQLAIRYAKAMGLKVVALDINDSVLELIQQVGTREDRDGVPDAVFNPIATPDYVKRIRKLTGLRGVHAAAAFSDNANAYATAQKILTYNGILMVVGMPPQDLKFSPMALSLGLIQVRGASNGTVQEVQRALNFTVKHGIIPDVQFRQLEDMPKMWEELEAGRATRRMVVRFDTGEEVRHGKSLEDGHGGGSKL